MYALRPYIQLPISLQVGGDLPDKNHKYGLSSNKTRLTRHRLSRVYRPCSGSGLSDFFHGWFSSKFSSCGWGVVLRVSGLHGVGFAGEAFQKKGKQTRTQGGSASY